MSRKKPCYSLEALTHQAVTNGISLHATCPSQPVPISVFDPLHNLVIYGLTPRNKLQFSFSLLGVFERPSIPNSRYTTHSNSIINQIHCINTLKLAVYYEYNWHWFCFLVVHRETTICMISFQQPRCIWCPDCATWTRSVRRFFRIKLNKLCGLYLYSKHFKSSNSCCDCCGDIMVQRWLVNSILS